MTPPELCPICGADVPRNAKACPECGACEKSGWSEDAAHDGLGLPDDEFEYDEFLKREFGGDIKPPGMKWFWWAAAVVALLAFLLLWLIPFASHSK